MSEKHSCAGRTWPSGAWRDGACLNTGKYEHDGKWWCKTHHPPTAKARKDERDRLRRVAYEAKVARWNQQAAQVRKQQAALAAIEKIAAGHNDPRGLAQEVLAMETK